VQFNSWLMKKTLLISLILLSWMFARCQHTLNGTISGMAGEKITLMQIFADKHGLIDTTYSDEIGNFRFQLTDGLRPGMYRVAASSGPEIDIIYNKEDIRFVFVRDEYGTYVQVIESVENMIYYDFVNLIQKNLFRLDVLSPVVTYYPKNDPFYGEVKNKVQNLREEISKRAQELTRNNPETMASHFITVEHPVFAPIGLNEEEQKEYLKAHYFDHIDFSDTVLLKTSRINSMIINYLTLYQSREDDRETTENNLLMALDTVLEKSVANPEMYASVVDFLLEGFQSIGFDKGMEYISEHNQLDQFCENTEKLIELQGKLELISRLAIGKTAPDFSHADMNGNMIHLDDIKAEKTLLVFWAAWCPHCKELVPELNRIAQEYSEQQIKIIGVSVDTSLPDLQSVIDAYEISWPNIAEGKGWDGEIPGLYGIAATPTMYLLDADKKIIAKPINKRDLKKALGY